MTEVTKLRNELARNYRWVVFHYVISQSSFKSPTFVCVPNALFFFLFFPIMIFQNVKDINKNNKKWNEWNYSISFPKINSYNYTNYCPKNRPTNRKIRIFIKFTHKLIKPQKTTLCNFQWSLNAIIRTFNVRYFLCDKS